jgi:hypothetical protein
MDEVKVRGPEHMQRRLPPVIISSFAQRLDT